MLANAVADKSLEVASQHSHGKLPIDLEFDRAFEERFDPKSSEPKLDTMKPTQSRRYWKSLFLPQCCIVLGNCLDGKCV